MTNKTASRYVVFGGTFDPVHEGHVSAIRFFLKDFPLVVIAPTVQNPWKDEQPTSLDDRLKMLKLVLADENIPYQLEPCARGVYLARVDYVYAKDAAAHFQRVLAGELHWGVGADSASGVKNWKDWPELQIPVAVAPVTIQIHATSVRERRAQAHPAVRTFIEKHSLYSF